MDLSKKRLWEVCIDFLYNSLSQEVVPWHGGGFSSLYPAGPLHGQKVKSIRPLGSTDRAEMENNSLIECTKKKGDVSLRHQNLEAPEFRGHTI